MAALRDELKERSLAEVSVAKVAAKAGLGRSAFYFYFSSKNEAVTHLLSDIFDSQIALADHAIHQPGDPRRNLSAALYLTVESWVSQSLQFVTMLDARDADVETRGIWEAWLRRYENFVATYIDDRRQCGEATARDLAHRLISLNERVLDRYLRSEGPVTARCARGDRHHLECSDFRDRGTVKALQLVAPGQLAVTDVAAPAIGDDDVLIRVAATGLCHSDVHIRHLPEAIFPLPLTLGHETAGQIVEYGRNVRNWSVGDIAVDRIDTRLDSAIRHGAHYALRADKGTVAEILALAGSRGAEAVFDFVGNQETVELAVETVAPDGVYQLVGIGGGHVPLLAAPRFGQGWPYGATVRTSYGGTKSDLLDCVALATRGRLTVDVETFPLAQAIEAFDRLEAGTINGRAVVIP